MEARIDYRKYAQQALESLYHLEKFVSSSGLEEKLLQLAKTRASQINGCALCRNMHTIDAGATGETEQRLYLLDAWQEMPFFSKREHAALAYTEAVTLVFET
jgi:AhpD family alkylhydroperoxidase